jgi:hypothetical protein
MGQKELVTSFGICLSGGVLKVLVSLPVVAFFFTVFTFDQFLHAVVVVVLCWARMKQQPPMHQFRMRPFKPFWG